MACDVVRYRSYAAAVAYVAALAAKGVAASLVWWGRGWLVVA